MLQNVLVLSCSGGGEDGEWRGGGGGVIPSYHIAGNFRGIDFRCFRGSG